jgi:hypothetical protein
VSVPAPIRKSKKGNAITVSTTSPSTGPVVSPVASPTSSTGGGANLLADVPHGEAPDFAQCTRCDHMWEPEGANSACPNCGHDKPYQGRSATDQLCTSQGCMHYSEPVDSSRSRCPECKGALTTARDRAREDAPEEEAPGPSRSSRRKKVIRNQLASFKSAHHPDREGSHTYGETQRHQKGDRATKQVKKNLNEKLSSKRF